MLIEFVTIHKQEIISRCKAKATKRGAPAPPTAGIDHGVPMFLDELVDELRLRRLPNPEVRKTATKHGHDLLHQGFTVSQVVHNYGDVCQSVTDLAMETGAPIATAEFRTLNRCLDDAIAGAVTEHARGQQVTRDGQSDELRHLVDTAITAFEVIQTGTVGVGGTTGGLVARSLLGIRALIGRPVAKTAQPTPPATSNSER